MNRTYSRYTRFATALLLTCGAILAHAQVLAEPQTVSHITDVAQFGMRPDAQFVACNGLECPARTPKHFAMTATATERPVVASALPHRTTPTHHVKKQPVRHRTKRRSQSFCH